MTKIDFYVLPENTELTRLQFACQLTEKIYPQQPIYIHMQNQQDAIQLDQLLWSYRADSFIPHSLYGDNNLIKPPVQIGYQAISKDVRDILLNLSDDIPSFYQQFSRIIEIVSADANIQASARERYRFYRGLALTIETHKL